MPERYDVIITGLGAAGSAAAFHLARRGLRVLGLDRASPPHGIGSHGGLTRMIRLLYAEHPGYVPLLHRAYELWCELERASGKSILHQTGGVYFGPESSRFVTGTLDAARQHRLAHEVVGGAEMASRFPLFRPPTGSVAIVDPAAGFLLADRAIESHLQLARGHGATLRMNEPVLEWHADAGGVAVRTAAGQYEASRLILAGGAWMPDLLGEQLRLPLKVTRQTLCWVGPKDPAPLTLGRLPVWAMTLDGRTLYYGFPITPDGSGGAGFKLAHHAPFELFDPHSADRPVRPEDAAAPLAFLREHIPSAHGPLKDVRVCLYTSTPDEHFVLDAYPLHQNVIVASPCSGHGFKFAPVVGEVLADLAEHGRTRHQIGFFSAHRFE
ncbi:MAG: N-methyl-L-tryptophan oxidase [Phycisphaerales bacterium]